MYTLQSLRSGESLSSSMPTICQKMSYNIIVCTRIDYASVTWNPHTDSAVNLMEQVPYSAVDFETGDTIDGPSLSHT